VIAFTIYELRLTRPAELNARFSHRPRKSPIANRK